MDSTFLQTFSVSIQLAISTTLILLFIGVPLSYYLTYSKSKWSILLHALVSLPLVLPPTVLGFYLLIAFSPQQGLGKVLFETFGIQLAFSFTGILIGSILFNLPFMVNSLFAGFTALPESLREAAYTLGKTRLQTLLYVLLPNCKPALITGACMTFVHTIGEFGVVLMIGGNIPGKTRVASLAVYDEVQALNFSSAHQYALYLLVFSFLTLLIIYLVNRKNPYGRRFD